MKTVEEIANKYSDRVLAEHLAQDIKSYAKEHAIKFLKHCLIEHYLVSMYDAKAINEYHNKWINTKS